MTNPTVFVCGGSSCSGTKAWRKMCGSLDAYALVTEVGCQKICDGPVCGVATTEGLSWFRDLDGDRLRQDLEELVTLGTMSKRLKARRVSKRQNKLRKE